MKFTKFFLSSFVLLVMVLVFSTKTHANLELLGQGTSTHGTYNLIYDTDLDITWYDFTNAGDTWFNQNDWAQGLSVTFGAATYSDWRLPIALVPDSDCTGVQSTGYNCMGGEMGHLWYAELGGTAGNPLGSTGDFLHLETSGYYWSDGGNSSNQYVFATADGNQSIFTTTYTNGKAMAVMNGSPIVPEPVSSILFIAGGATFGFRRFRKSFKK